MAATNDINYSVTGNPGQGNTFQQTDIQSATNVNPAATTVNNNFYPSPTGSRMESYFACLCKEISEGVTAEIVEDLLNYTTRLDGTKGLEEKLTDGGFKQSNIAEAIRLKEMYAKRATRFECYPSAQQINLDLFARIKHEFDTYVMPLIEDGESLSTVRRQTHEKIVVPIMNLLESTGAADQHLHYTEDHIYGMIYYLTGMCHLNWKDYDNV